MTSPPCVSTGTRIPCDACNRHFRSASCFENHKKRMMGWHRNKKTVCKLKRNCSVCNYPIIPREKHECYKRYCKNCNQNMPAGHLCYMVPLSDAIAPCNRVLYILYDFEATQDTRYNEKATEHVPNLVSVQQFCSQCEDVADIDQDCPQCGKCKHSFWEDQVGDLLTCL
jgi:hypothetical protein